MSCLSQSKCYRTCGQHSATGATATTGTRFLLITHGDNSARHEDNSARHGDNSARHGDNFVKRLLAEFLLCCVLILVDSFHAISGPCVA